MDEFPIDIGGGKKIVPDTGERYLSTALGELFGGGF
jgi:hypothetical protein